MKILIGTLFLILLYAVLQQGPLLLGSIAKYPVAFVSVSPGKFIADVTGIPKGMYYLSVGKVLGDTQIRMNGVLLQQSRLIAGVPIDLTDDQSSKSITIECVAKEEWRKRLFDSPIVAKFGIGLLIQEWRIFNGIFMGPVSSLLLVLMALFNLRLSKTAASQIMPHLLCGVAGGFYSLSLSGIPDLFFDPSINTIMQCELRVLVSAALIYLIDTYAGRRHLAILWTHVLCMVLIIVICLSCRAALTDIYELEISFFCIATLIATLSLFKAKRNSLEIELMICLGMSWTAVQALGIILHYVSAIANMTVWSPSFIATLAVANFYFIYRKAVNRSAEIQLSKQQYYLAAQIAHDIRSPLATLNTVVQDAGDLSDSTRDQIKSVVMRIRGIANNLLIKNPRDIQLGFEELQGESKGPKFECFGLSGECKTHEFLVPILSSLVSEKRLQFSRDNHIQILLTNDKEKFEFASNIQRSEFSRVVSNLINNAVEAVGSRGDVTVDLKGNEHQVQIIIQDTGVGMAPDVISKIGTRGYSYGKNRDESGSGLGVYHAMETIRSWGGRLNYESELGKGTRAIITLPRVKSPDWFAESIKVKAPATAIILDVDPSMFEVWRDRFRSAGLSEVQVIGFSTSRDLIQWYRETLGDVDNPLYVCDHELGGGDRKGLDVIEMLGVASDAILVTHEWDDIDIRSRCLKLGIKVLPKSAQVAIIRTCATVTS
jgi:signal transduction histidine kinase